MAICRGAAVRIAQVCPYSLSEPGGVQAQVLGLARCLARRRHEVTVLGPADRPVVAPEGVEVVAVGPTVAVEANGSLAPIAVSVKAAAAALGGVRRRRFDIVHLHEPLVPGATMALLLAVRIPTVGTFHLSGASASYRLLGPVVRSFASKLSVRCCVSVEAKTTAEEALGGAFTVIFNGVDTERFRKTAAGKAASPGRPIVAFVGRHEERKGLGVLLEAMDGIQETIRLRIAGEGPLTESLRERYRDSRVEWLGRIDDEGVAELLGTADVVCAPSLAGESFGIVLLEAMAAGAPVVASDIAGYRNVVHGGAGLLVPPGEAAALAAALRSVLGDQKLASALRQAGRERAAQFSMTNLAARYEEIYATLM